MSLLNLDEYGGLCPPQLHKLSLSELEEHFVRAWPASTTRAQIFSKYQRYLLDIRQVLGVGFLQWVNGSFTGDKRDPSDIDVLNFIPYTEATNQQAANLFSFLKAGGSLDTYRVDGHLAQLYPMGDPRQALTHLTMGYWASGFGFDGRGSEKLVVELFIP